MALAFEERLAAGRASQSGTRESEARLTIDVIFTSVPATLTALKHAGELASRLGARITLVVPQVVPWPAPLETPPVLIDFNENRFRVLASQSPVETSVCVYLCRDRWEALKLILPPRSVVVLGGPKRWWPTRESRLVRKLRRAGHDVVFTEVE